ncbi:polysaccharide biosynthesis/export family protein [Mesorhizobium sp. M0684]|uniref:polysaccharide biosynthesis/export family protein n=1 Tax=Mesorhizobium sp. M0684 TaxID=2956986 RepID=UPI0033386E9D
MSKSLGVFLTRCLKPTVAGLVLLICFGNTAVAEEYLLAKGDVLEFQVLGIPDLRQRSPIGMDGTVLLPLVGAMQAAGRTVSAVRDAVVAQAPQKGYPVQGVGGDVWQFVHPEAVVLQVVEYRPIYLTGDVANPGEQPFRSGMTVRQAIAVAGGYDLVRLRIDNPILELTDLKTQYNTTWPRLAAAQIRVARLRAELEGRDETSLAVSADGGLSAGLLPEIEQVQGELLANRVDDHSKEKQAVRVSLQHIERRLDLLSRRQENEQTAKEEDTIELERVRRLNEKGLASVALLNDARRAVLLWSTRALESFAEASRMERERNDLQRNLVRIEDSRRIELLGELTAAMLDVADLNAQLQGNAEKLVYVGGLRSELARGGRQSPPEITVVRKSADAVDRISANEETDLWPGDVVEITLNVDWILAPSLRPSIAAEKSR